MLRRRQHHRHVRDKKNQQGEKFGRYTEDFSDTENISNTLVRLPLFSDLVSLDSSRVIEVLLEFDGVA